MSRANARKYVFCVFYWGVKMNFCVLLGKIVSDIEFKFIINGKNKSIAYFDMELLNKSIIQIKAYNEMADYIYRKLKMGQIVVVDGKITHDGTIECFKIIFNSK